MKHKQEEKSIARVGMWDSHIRGKMLMKIRDQEFDCRKPVTAGVNTTIAETNVVSTNCTLKIPYTFLMKPHLKTFSSAGMPGYNAGGCPNPVSMSP